jgi:hypothetical protein
MSTKPVGKIDNTLRRYSAVATASQMREATSHAPACSAAACARRPVRMLTQIMVAMTT